MITIHQGKPKSKHFTILQPVPGGVVKIGDEVKCVDPKSKEETVGKCVDRWTVHWHELPDSFCLLTYGKTGVELKNAIEKKKNFQNKEEISFLLIKESEK